MKFEFQMEQDEQMIHGKIEADSEEVATEMVKNSEYTNEDIISREPNSKVRIVLCYLVCLGGECLCQKQST